MNHSKFLSEIKNVSVEEEVKALFIKILKLKANMKSHHDLFHERMLFEFKYDLNFKNYRITAKVIAQLSYYLRRLKFGDSSDNVPIYCCVIDKNEGFIFNSSKLSSFCFEAKSQFDWDLSPSNPDPKLIDAILQSNLIKDLYVYDLTSEHEYLAFLEEIKNSLESQLELEFCQKKDINENNFEHVFEIWNEKFEDSVKNGSKASRYFLCDIKKSGSFYRKDDSTVTFLINQDDAKIKKVFSKDYEHFWSLYNKVEDANVLRNILTKSDRISDDFQRRIKGEFFTPLLFAKKGLTYLEKFFGENWLSTGKYRVWDMACGTGNLEYYIKSDDLKYVYMSTIDENDISYSKRLFPGAQIFKYDFLNDDVSFLSDQKIIGLKHLMPQKLVDDLSNKDLTWIILINPPYATSQVAGNSSESKKDVSKTAIRELMHAEGFGEPSRELFSQFIYRINLEFKHNKAFLAMFSKLKYLNSNNDQAIRDKIFNYSFSNGFIFNSLNFQGVKAPFPIGFLIWNLFSKIKLENQEIIVDILDDCGDKIGKKEILTTERTNFLNKWIKREKTTQIFPSVSSSYNVKESGADLRNRITDNFLGSLMCKGNDFANQKYVALLSMPYASAGALSITPSNFEQAMIIHAVRKVTTKTWINDRDQYYIPSVNPSDEFIFDCIIWSLFSNSNETVSVNNISYLKKTYIVKNHFFPFIKTKIENWISNDVDATMQMNNDSDRYTALYIHQNISKLSIESQELLERGEEAYKYFYKNRNNLNLVKYKATTWDAGWWQIRNLIFDAGNNIGLKNNIYSSLNKLAKKINDKVYEYEILV